MKSIKTTILFLYICIIYSYAQDNKFIYVKNDRLYTPDGKELALWGANFQSSISFEYAKLKSHGVEETAESLNNCTSATYYARTRRT